MLVLLMDGFMPDTAKSYIYQYKLLVESYISSDILCFVYTF